MIGVYYLLSKIESQDLMQDYIEHADRSRRIFTGDAYDAIWEYSRHFQYLS
jgi:hypothetical protein